MIRTENIMPVSSLRNSLAAIEKIVTEKKEPVLLTKNGRSSMVLIDSEDFEIIQRQRKEAGLKQAIYNLEHTRQWLTSEEVLTNIKERLYAAEKTMQD
jgi:prevent-host-death family protein